MEIADKTGVYKDFSGKIKWKSTDKIKWRRTICVVRNADFEILEKDDNNGKGIIFFDAVFVSGDALWCVIKNGLNLGCNFYFCDIDYMINKGGKIYGSNWHDGIFEGGVFDFSRWFDGIWISGKWVEGKNSRGEIMDLTPDKWDE